MEPLQEVTYAVCVLIIGKLHNGTYGAVGVARRTDAASFGLIGGKVDEGETPVEAAIRECREESGIRIWSLAEVYRRSYDNRIVITYMANHEGEPTTQSNEPECRWCSFDELLAGRFGEYNKDLLNKLGLG